MEFPIRINKYLTLANYCSRRQADRLIEDNAVKINSLPVKLGDKVSEGDIVTVDDNVVNLNEEKKIYLAFNKPVGIICTTDKNAKDNIVKYINYKERVYPVGRLDVKTAGLILLTNDGSIVNKILRSENKIEKEYLVEINRKIEPELISGLSRGVRLEEFKTLPAVVRQFSDREFNLIITEGKKRQVRRMCEAFDYKVLKLTRIRIGNIKLENLKVGAHRIIPEKEINKLIG